MRVPARRIVLFLVVVGAASAVFFGCGASAAIPGAARINRIDRNTCARGVAS